jgi:hypothetical protein
LRGRKQYLSDTNLNSIETENQVLKEKVAVLPFNMTPTEDSKGTRLRVLVLPAL